MLSVKQRIIVTVCFLIGFARVYGVTHSAYQALAHFWVCGLFCAAYWTPRWEVTVIAESRSIDLSTEYKHRSDKWFYLWCALALTVLEIIAATVTVINKHNLSV